MVTSSGANRGARKRIRIGVALSATELCAADIRLRGGEARVWRIPLEPLNGDASWPSLATALAELARLVGANDGVLAVALMPPLTEVRRLELPPVGHEELERLLTRNAARYFVNARGVQVVGASSFGKRKRGGPAPVVAAAASARLVAAIRAAAEQSGWSVECIAPAESAWSASARTLWPALARGEASVIVAQDERTDVLHLRDGQLAGLRRFRGGAADAPMIADMLRSSPRAAIAGTPTVRRELAASLDQFGVRVLAPDRESAFAADRGDSLAAHFAGEGGGPVLRSEEATAVDKAQAKTLVLTLSAIAAVLLVFSAGVELWGVKRQLREVRDERAALRGQIAATLVGRTTLDATYRKVAALNAVERTSPRWSAVISSLSDAIPEEAYLTAIRTRQDSLVVDGLAQHAARVFDALASTQGLVDVHSAAPVRRQAQEDGPALEHFTIGARVEPARERPPTASPASNGAARRPGP